MKKAVQYNDVLGNVIQIKTVIDLFMQIENKPCWIVESRKIIPHITQWDNFQPLKNQYFVTEKEAQEAVIRHITEYAEKAQRLGKDIQFEEIIL